MAVAQRLIDELTSTVRDHLSEEALRRSNDDEARLTDDERKALAADILQTEFKRIDQQMLKLNRPRMDRDDRARVKREVLANATGLGKVELLLADPTVEEVAYNSFDFGLTYHSDGSVRRADMSWQSDAELREWLAYLASTKGGTARSFNSQNPLLVLQIGEGLRLAATTEVSQTTSFTLRRNTLGEVTLADLVRLEMFPAEVAALLRDVVRAPEMRIVVVGATTAGKTTLVRAMLNELDPLTRVGIVEDTREIGLRSERHRNVEEWEVRTPNAQGEGAVTEEELVAQLFRYRADRLILGEVRRAEQAVPMLNAMSNGMGSLTTTHEHSARGGLERLAEMLAQGTAMTRGMELGLAKRRVARAVDLVVHVDRGHYGRRYISEILEVVRCEGDQILTEPLYAADHTGNRTALKRLSSEEMAKRIARGKLSTGGAVGGNGVGP